MAFDAWGWFGSRSSGEGQEFEAPATAKPWGWFGNRSSGEGLEFDTASVAWINHSWLRGGQMPQASESGGGVSANADGSPTGITTIAANANAYGSAVASSVLSSVSLTGSTATAQGAAVASGASSAIVLATATASASGSAIAAGETAGITLPPAMGSASNAQNASASGACVYVVLTPAIGVAIFSQVPSEYVTNWRRRRA